MLITRNLEKLTAWIRDNVCSEITFLKPDEMQMGDGYTPEYINPAAFTLYIPAKDLLPPDIETKLPAVCVQLKDGDDDLISNDETLNIRLAFATWNPGEYTQVEETDEEGNTVTKQILSTNADGWKDVWLFLDKTKRIIQKQMYIEGMKVDRTTKMKFGFFTIDETMVNAYPEWYAWVDFTLKCGLAAAPENDIQQYL